MRSNMRNIKSLVIVTFTALSLFIMAPAVFAGNGKGMGNGAGDGSGPVNSILEGVAVEVSGTVASFGTKGAGIGIDNGVEVITVYGMGPLAFWDAAGIAKPEIGEDIVVNGFEITLSDGSFKIIAASVSIAGEELILRDPVSGAPLWRGIKKNHGTGDCTGDGTGDCIYSAIDNASLILSATRTKNQKKDGSCLLPLTDNTELFLSANQTRTKSQKKDGSCLLPLTDSMTDSMILAKGGNGNGGGGHGPGDGSGNGGNGPKDGSGNGNKSGTCTTIG
ncbi:MAG: hypothetical protein PF482_14935 [Desulfobacteraceae bacterium]|jgi:hypothetical protein|nr:hypothetical protein [Desulfobacteraceae bacterium]